MISINEIFNRTLPFVFKSIVFLQLIMISYSEASVERPTQFVLFAFDGSRSIPMWRETQNFAALSAQQQAPVKFTYFINTAYYLAQIHRFSYLPPQRNAGESAIGFGGTWYEVAERFIETNKAFQAGHEIANHATGHWDGSLWNASQWNSELSQFYNILFQITKYNSSVYPHGYESGWRLKKSDIIGFRAPQLGQNSAMYSVLKSHGIVYDTSLTARSDSWPFKNAAGTWMYPLASINVAGTNRKTLSMDYNFYFLQSQGREVDQPATIKKFEDQMYLSYLQYFKSNYNGNRAPIHIGHHFSKWNGGAYWNAMKRAVKTFCQLKEVKCVTYLELTKFLNQLSPTTLAHYQRGNFIKMRAYNPQLHPEMTPASFNPLNGPKKWDDDTMKRMADPVEAHED